MRRQVLVQHVAVSPNGEWAAYSRRTIEDGKYRSRLWRVPLGRGRPEQLTLPDGNDIRPAFSPDGAQLLFLSDRTGRLQPWVLPLAGGEPRQVAELEGQVGAATWAPNGQSLLLLAPSGEDRFRVGEHDDPVARQIRDLTWRLDGYGIRDQFNSVWVVPARGGRPRRLTQPAYEVTDAAWSAERVVFLADQGDQASVIEYPQLHAISARGGRTRQLATLRGFVWSLAVSPRGALAVVGVDRADPVGWEIVSLFVVESGKARQLGAGLDRPVGNHTFADTVELTEILMPRAHWLNEETLVAIVSDRGGSRPYRFPVEATQLRCSTTPKSSAPGSRSGAGASSSPPHRRVVHPSCAKSRPAACGP